VHRDIKPANILLENSVERVRITDFGLARAVDDVSQTQSGILAGTPQYMSPEQAAGETVDHRADLFSLGSVLYAMCTGRSPFRAESTVAVLRRICDGDARPVRELNSDVPEWLVEIIDKLHAKQPADRFQSASEVADLLERHLAHVQQPTIVPQPARLRVEPLTMKITPWPKRMRLLTTAGIMLCLVALAAVGYREWYPAVEDAKEPRSPLRNGAAGVSATGSGAAAAVAAASPDSQLTGAPTDGSTLEEIENRPLEIELGQLRRALMELETSLAPHEPRARLSEKPAITADTERRLKLLEEEMRNAGR